VSGLLREEDFGFGAPFKVILVFNRHFWNFYSVVTLLA
jgi:hypothetical protein